MNLPHNALVLQSVGVCKLHGNAELGKRTAEKLFQIGPDIDSTYITANTLRRSGILLSLSNILAANGLWDDSSEAKALMTSRGFKKETGYRSKLMLRYMCSGLKICFQVSR